jgi:hypothetical protein
VTLTESRSTDQLNQTTLGRTTAPVDSALALRLSDSQLEGLVLLCQPLVPRCRDALLRILSYQLRGRHDIGDGELYRTARNVIRDNKLFDPPLEVEPHHQRRAGP